MKHKLKIDIANTAAVLALLRAAEVKWECGRLIDDSDTTEMIRPVLFLTTHGTLRHGLAGYTTADKTVTKLSELSEYLFPEQEQRVLVDLREGEAATVDYENKVVRVGCKTVPFSVVPKFVRIIEPLEELELDGDVVEVNHDERYVECDGWWVTFDEIKKIAALVERGA